MRHIGTYLGGTTDLETTISELDRELERAMARAYN